MPGLHSHGSNIPTHTLRRHLQTSLQFSVLMPSVQSVASLTSQEVRHVCRSCDELSQRRSCTGVSEYPCIPPTRAP